MTSLRLSSPAGGLAPTSFAISAENGQRITFNGFLYNVLSHNILNENVSKSKKKRKMKRFLLPGRFVFWRSFDLHISSYSSDRVTNVRNENDSAIEGTLAFIRSAVLWDAHSHQSGPIYWALGGGRCCRLSISGIPLSSLFFQRVRVAST